ncbi:DUF4280 domain-containing protein [Clostridium saccharobutylicum]|uniref:DUF4280 domain-containing protein n=1 Tax=Clostridium saccharobutylicum DSM 13864 TaxID=1345695 RepID=U5MYA6_CLOSA|nr:DUF4280 domain-containing protein [Clostridium saccharobutylicum]AGX44626.1 hypothetical protein CLSA_c36650 [Clostridium saccharobutylicum DSM 13864]AQR91916.1 hypothetical protein CLOSC_36440 [Clostridium saccharobutylicum]AQS01818.1 hypothetical protein CSACC_36490 [Clostridium saccharobutylicum]AQS15801.1 hypothetical protein CLOSACC_36490 [Clostridium saccharobutylicum]MBA2903403.1 hypothetical protein [Clostridium saccharobutylicum]
MAMTYVVDGAKIKCSKAIGESTLKKSDEWNLELHDKKMLTVADNKPDENVVPFKMCTSSKNPKVKESGNNQAPCKPVILKKWAKGKTDVYLKGELALNSECILSCMYGGIIKIIDDGQSE